MNISHSKDQIRNEELEKEEVKKPLLKKEYREDEFIFLNFTKQQSAKLFNFEITESKKDDSR